MLEIIISNEDGLIEVVDGTDSRQEANGLVEFYRNQLGRKWSVWFEEAETV